MGRQQLQQQQQFVLISIQLFKLHRLKQSATVTKGSMAKETAHCGQIACFIFRYEVHPNIAISYSA